MTDYVALGAQLRANRQAEQQQRQQQTSMSGAPTPTGTAVVGPSFSSYGNSQQNNGQMQPTSSPLTSAMDMATKYNQVSNGGLNKMFGSTPTTGALGTSYAGSGMGGTGYGLGGNLVSGGISGSGEGSGLGAMLGSYGSSSAPASFGTLGSTTTGGTGGLLSGAGAQSGASLGGGGAAAGSGAGSGLAGTAGGLAGLAALSYLGDKEMNENKGSMINADKLNSMGSVNGIGLRFGDLANGFNPATWLSDPSKAAKGLGNFFTLGFLDKIF